MVAFLKSDLFLKFTGGFVLGLVGVMTLNPAEAQPRQNDQSTTAAYVQPVSNDAL